MKKILLIPGLLTAIAAFSTPTLVLAATATSPVVTLSVPVNSPTCTVSNSSSTMTMPAASVGQTVTAYQALNLPNTPASDPTATGVFTSNSLNQTATISCNSANTAIASFVVQPGPSAVTATAPGVAVQFLVDATTPTPVRLAAGSFAVVAEQVSVNGTAAPQSYGALSTYAINPYSTPFSTGALNTASPPVSTATVVWRPIVITGVNNQVKIAAATGGLYNGSFQIIVNY